MILWNCTNCGAGECLTFIPDCCSSCGGPMETQDGRSTLGSLETDPDWEMEICAYNGEPDAIIAMWQSGRPLTLAMQSVLDDMLLANRIELITEVYRDAA